MLSLIKLLTLIPFFFTLYIASFFYVLLKNYLVARKCGLPLLVVPIHPNHLFWMIISIPLRPVLKAYLPYDIYKRFACAVYGWEFHEKRIIFQQMNTQSFILVTCGKNELWTIDSDFNGELLRRMEDFPKAEIGNEILGMFGRNLFTSDGEEWSRQRKLVMSIINERISKVVFEETRRQTMSMLKDVNSSSDSARAEKTSYPATFASMRQIASNVLFRAAYGTTMDFERASSPNPQLQEPIKLDMLECIAAVLRDMAPAAFVSPWICKAYPKFLPGVKRVRELGAAKEQFPGHVDKRLANEKKALAENHDADVKGNLTSMLIRASEQGDMVKSAQGKTLWKLSEEDLRGNLFIFTVAGFESTANVLAFALVALMSRPEWQDWLCEEIDALFQAEGVDNDEEDIDYVAFYPKAIRCLALMMEIMRLYPPVLHTTRATPKDRAIDITTNGKTYTIPADAHIYGSLPAIHRDPKIWRNLNLPDHKPDSQPMTETLQDMLQQTKDEYQFRPARWINPTTKAMFQPPRGSYTPFFGGPRVCPGQKMAQIEFVCVILTLFRRYKIEAVRLEGETDEQIQKRLDRVLNVDVHAELTLVMERIGEVDVTFVKRRP